MVMQKRIKGIMKASFFIQMNRDADIPGHQSVYECTTNGVLAIFKALVRRVEVNRRLFFEITTNNCRYRKLVFSQGLDDRECIKQNFCCLGKIRNVFTHQIVGAEYR
jgi:hypothetical protein